MSKRDSGPGRPPPPKNNSMKFSLKSLEDREEDEDLLTSMTGELDKKVSENRRVNEENKILGRTAEGRAPPRPQTGPKLKEDDKFSKWKQNLSDISVVVRKKVSEKLEDFSKEIKPEAEIESSSPPKVTPIKQRSIDNADLVSFVKRKDDFSDVEDETSPKIKETVDDIQVVDDYFHDVAEPLEDFNGVQSLPELRFRNVSLQQKIRRSKSSVTTGTVSMSNLKAHADVVAETIENINTQENSSANSLYQTVNASGEAGSNQSPSAEKKNETSVVPWHKLIIGIEFICDTGAQIVTCNKCNYY